MNQLPEKYRTAAIVTPSKIGGSEQEAAYAGVYTTIIAMITLNGGQLTDVMLRRNLERMNAANNMPGGKTEVVLQKFVKQGYLVKTVEKKQGADDEAITWNVGPRGKMEVGPEAIVGLVKAVYGERAMQDLEKRLRVSLGLDNEPVQYQEEESLVGNTPVPESVSGGRRSSSRRTRRAQSEDD